jgi:hypothetical protein
MHVIEHHHIADEQKPETCTDLPENLDEPVSGADGLEERLAAITTNVRKWRRPIP